MATEFNPYGEFDRIFLFIREEMRRQGYRYADLAQHLGVSVPTVKRLFASQDVTLSRLGQICFWLGFSLTEAMQAANSSQQKFTFTREQEVFFSRQPHFLAYLMLLQKRGVTPLSIEEEEGISRESTLKYIEVLVGFRLIQFVSLEDVRVLPKGTMYWDDNGPLGQTFSRALIRELTDHILDRLGNHTNEMLHTFTKKLTPEQYAELSVDQAELMRKYDAYSLMNSKPGGRVQSSRYTIMIAAAEKDTREFSKIKNL